MTSDHPMNRFIRESRSGPTFTSGTPAEVINRALREAAGRGEAPAEPAQQQPPAAELPRLGGSDYLLKDEEVSVFDEPTWQAWMHRRRVIRLLDRAGRLPGERGYDQATSGPADPDRFDLEQAIAARRQRWRQRTGV